MVFEEKRMIIIGGNSQNAGKTFLATHLISKYSKSFDIIAFKIKFIESKNSFVHYADLFWENNGLLFLEEKNAHDSYDSSRMLLAGAKKAYFVQVLESMTEIFFVKMIDLFSNYNLIVCESNNLNNFFKPSLFVFCKRNYVLTPKNKPEFVEKADLVLNFDGKSFDFDLEKIVFDGHRWKID